MAKIQAAFPEPTKQDGTPVNIAPQAEGESNPRAFQPIKPDFYAAIVHSLKFKTYRASWGKDEKQIKSPVKDGLWDYAALTPSVEILNGETNEGVNSIVTRQDVTLGVQFQGSMCRPDKLPESPFFKDGERLLTALGMFIVSNGRATINGDTDHVIDRPVKVFVSNAGYVTGKNVNFNPQALTLLFTRLNGDDTSYTSEDISNLVDAYNREMGYVDDNGEQVEFIYTDKNGKELAEPLAVRLKLKNAITKWYFPSTIDARVNGWVVRDGKFFMSANHADSYERIVAAASYDTGNEDAGF